MAARPPKSPVKLPVLATPKPLDAARLFREHFLPLYPPGVNLEELRRTDANPAGNPAIVRAIDETAEVFTQLAPEALGVPDLSLDRTDASIHRLSAALTREARDAMFARRAAPGDPPLLVHFMIHAAVYVGATVVATRGDAARWLVRSPLWETRVALASKAGTAELAPFSWLLRSLADDGLGHVTLADRYRTLVETPTEDAASWPVWCDPERRLPRLGRVRYDLVYQHLKKHLPELEDFGEDFPPPARFEELGFEWLGFELVGAGRALVIHGPTRHGLHLLWLTNRGFAKSVFVPADRAPEHRLERGTSSAGDETLVLRFGKDGAEETREYLWWGP